MSRWGELIPHSEDDPACLCGCQDEDAIAGDDEVTLIDTGTFFVEVPKRPGRST